MDNEVAEARARLAAKFGKVQLGGKGTSGMLTSASRLLVTYLCLFDTIFIYRHLEESPEEISS